MTIRELADLVGEMRHWQREFFRTRNQDALAKSKSLERRVDETLAAIRSPQRGLFDQE